MSCRQIGISVLCVIWTRSLVVQLDPVNVPVEDLLVELAGVLGWGPNSQELSLSLAFQCESVTLNVAFHTME